MKNILITGGTGLIGKVLAEQLVLEGYSIKVLSRNRKSSKPNVFYWDYEKGEIDSSIFNDLHGIIHLAGANIGLKRWTKNRKKEIIASRVDSVNFLFEEIKKRNVKLEFFISASATGIYGAKTSENIFTEKSELADDFLGLVCRKWEESADRFIELGVRVVKLRTGVVLTKNGGALDKIVKPIRMGIGAVLGTGLQFFPWIHISDLCRIYKLSIENINFNGAYNAVTNNHITNYDLTRSLAKSYNKKVWLPNVPSFILRMVFGEMAVVILSGSRVSAQKLLEVGFEYQFPTIETAINDLL